MGTVAAVADEALSIQAVQESSASLAAERLHSIRQSRRRSAARVGVFCEHT
jgi:hypothetical protein